MTAHCNIVNFNNFPIFIHNNRYCIRWKFNIPYKQKIWLEKMLAIWKINSFSELNLTITHDPSIIFSIIQKTWRIKFGELHKKSPTAKFNSMSNFLLIQ